MPELGWIAADFATRSAKPAGMPVSVTWRDAMLWLVLGYRYGDGEQMSDGRGLSAGWKHGRAAGGQMVSPTRGNLLPAIKKMLTR
jgi:hypothetical protein